MKLGEETIINNRKAKIIEIFSYDNITVEFEDGVILKNRNYSSFKQKSLKHPYDKNTYGVGYIGEEYYGRTKEDIRCYKTWQSMLERCYSEKHLKKRPTYKDCYVCDEWLCYSNFKKWYDNNYYEIKDERMCLDKDILIKGNKVYSPNTCVFVPNKINMLVLQNKSVRNLKIGVIKDADSKSYIARLNINGKKKHIGSYDTEEEAFKSYKKAKEEYIKEVAEEYKNLIPKILYDALINFEVDIND